MIPRLTNIPFLYCHSLHTSRGFTPFTSPSQTTTSAYPSSSSTVTPSHFPGPHPVKLPLLSTPPLTILPPQSWPPSHHSPPPSISLSCSLPQLSPSPPHLYLFPHPHSLHPPPLLTPLELLSLRQSTRS